MREPPLDQGAALEACARLIEADDVPIVAQPIVDLARARIAGYECLARFPSGPGLSTEQWFEFARRTGIGARLEAATLRAALRLRTTLPANCFLTVNISPQALLAPAVTRVFTEVSDLGGVVVELTEHTLVRQLDATVEALDRLRSAGAMIAIDDAGAGHAGLKQLLDVRPDLLKLDRSLVSGIDRNESKRALVEMLGVFADRVDAWVLAEGLETEAELRTVVDLGVPLGQGWVLGRPAGPWRSLDRRAEEMLGGLAAAGGAHAGPTARTLIEHVAWCPVEEVARLADRPWEIDEVVVVLDARQRPAALVDESSAWAGGTERLLRVHPDTPLDVLARRMIARPRRERFDPAVVTDPAGRYLGVVHPERVMSHLAGVAATAGLGSPRPDRVVPPDGGGDDGLEVTARRRRA